MMYVECPFTGTRRYLGNNPAPLRMAWPVYGVTPQAPLIPRDKWDDLIPDGGSADHPFLPYVHNQANVGQCNADATAALAEFCRAQAGLPFVQLSAADLYDRINRGGDNGSLLEDAIEQMLNKGIGTAATSGTIWRRGMTQASAEERAKFKALEVYLCPTFDHVMSASLMGFGVVSGVWWYNNGFDVGSDGWMPDSGWGGRGGHAVFGYKPARKGNKYGIWHQNSWTEKWGLTGRAVFPSSWYQQGGIGGWWACRVMTHEGGDVPAPKIQTV